MTFGSSLVPINSFPLLSLSPLFQGIIGSPTFLLSLPFLTFMQTTEKTIFSFFSTKARGEEDVKLYYPESERENTKSSYSYCVQFPFLLFLLLFMA